MVKVEYILFGHYRIITMSVEEYYNLCDNPYADIISVKPLWNIIDVI